MASDRARWYVGCAECAHESPNHAEDCPVRPVTEAQHRTKLIAELADPQWAEIARLELARLDSMERPSVIAAASSNCYVHRDGTSYTHPWRAFYIDEPGVWYLNDDGDLIHPAALAHPDRENGGAQ